MVRSLERHVKARKGAQGLDGCRTSFVASDVEPGGRGVCRGAEFLNNVAIALMGTYCGSAAKMAVTASSLFGSISGSTVSNVISTGAITIPLMKRAGYRAESAGTIEAAASTRGQLMPLVMGAVAFLMAEDLRSSTAKSP